MYKNALRPAWVEIDLRKLDKNVKNIMRKARTSEIIGVIKADAYGHGAIKCAEVLRSNGVQTFAVATLREAIDLRRAGAHENILILGLTPNMYADTLVEYDLFPVVCSSENAAAISKAAIAAKKTVPVYIAVDTGMGRIGYLFDDKEAAIQDIKRIAEMENLAIRGLFSHMATADQKDKAFAKEQEARYNAFFDAVVTAGIHIPSRTLANSASIMEIPGIHFDEVRPGIVLYGCYPSDEVDRGELAIEPVMSVKANIVQVKDVPAGFSCGYGRKFIADRPAKIATIPMGYADGLPRPYSSVGKVLVGGMVCPIAGNICMDQFMVDVTNVLDARAGDEVIIMGSDGRNSITADDIAAATGTISYEVCCAFGQRLPKVYLK